MSEITKLYDNAKIAPKKCSECDNNMDCGFGKDCYIPFTAEKQLLLLQLLARIESADYFQFFFYEQEWILRLNMLTELSCESAYVYESRNKNFNECIAGLINIIWQDLTEKEREAIYGILRA